jgi:hypothetical protein
MKKGMYKMKTWLKVLLVTLLFGVPAFFLAPRIWPMSSDWPTPTSQQFPFFVLIAVFDSLTFGLGIAFLLFGWPIVQRIANESGILAWVLYIIIAFMLLSWWPHDNLHSMVGTNMQGLLYIEYGFHVSQMFGGAIVAYSFLRLFRQGVPSM